MTTWRQLVLSQRKVLTINALRGFFAVLHRNDGENLARARLVRLDEALFSFSSSPSKLSMGVTGNEISSQNRLPNSVFEPLENRSHRCNFPFRLPGVQFYSPETALERQRLVGRSVFKLGSLFQVVPQPVVQVNERPGLNHLLVGRREAVNQVGEGTGS